MTGKPFPPPQNTDSPERGWKVPCFRSNQHFSCKVPHALHAFRHPRVLLTFLLHTHGVPHGNRVPSPVATMPC